MKTFIRFAACVAAFISITLSASAQENKPLQDFDQLKAGSAFEIELFPADRHSIYIEPGLEGQVTTTITNGLLELDTKHKGPVKVKIYFRQLKAVELTGAANASNKDTINAPQFSVMATGASKARLVLKADLLTVNAEGAADVTLSGSSPSATYNVTGAASLKAYDMQVNKVTVHSTGAGNARVHATELLSAQAEGVSHIAFSGSPAYKNISVNGVATVKDKADGDEYVNSTISSNKDTTRVRIGKKKFLIIDDDKDKDRADQNSRKRRRMKSVWGGFELGVNGLVTPGMNFSHGAGYSYLDTKLGKSWFFGLNFPEIDGQIIRNKLAVTTGIGMSWHNIHFEGNSFLAPNVDSLAAFPSAPGVNLSLNKLFTYDLTAPLLVKFAPGNKKRSSGGFHIAAGAIVHYVVTSSVVTETTSNGYPQRVELEDDFNINPFRADATVRVGYGRVKFFANYSLTPYFNNSKAPDVRAFAAGVTLIGF